MNLAIIESIAKVNSDFINLIDVSHDLLAALKILRERHQIDDPHHADLCEFCKQADAAIIKAEGH